MFGAVVALSKTVKRSTAEDLVEHWFLNKYPDNKELALLNRKAVMRGMELAGMWRCNDEFYIDGIRVLDASNVIAGPFAASLLGISEREVIKVEMPNTGDSAAPSDAGGWEKPSLDQPGTKQKVHNPRPSFPEGQGAVFEAG
jgi:hypothetical protein